MFGQVRRVVFGSRLQGVVLVALATLVLAPAAGAFTLKVAGPSEAPRMVFDHQMKVVSVCLPVTNPAGGTSLLYGQRFTDGPVRARTPAIVLAHGIASSTENWDFSSTWSVARALASAGYVVFSYDRLGYARSSYFDHPGGGETLTTAAHRAMLHQVVGDVKSGGYRTLAAGAAGCAGSTSPGNTANRSVVIIGHSAGGWIVAGYPGQYHDVAAMIQADISGSSSSSSGVAKGGGFTPDPAHPDYFQFFRTTQNCRDFNTYPPGVVQYAVNIACKPPFLDSPFGEITDIAAMYAQNDINIARIGPSIPVLLTSGDHDTTDPPSSADADYAYYKAHCGCDVTQLLLPETAHLFMVHRSLPMWVDHVVAWLAAHGVLGTPKISAASVTHRRFRVGRHRTAVTARHRTPVGTAFRFKLSEPAAVTVTITRLGTRHRAGMLKRRAEHAGRNRIRFSGRVGRRALRPGRYRAVLRARNAGGRSRPVTLRFRIIG